jgi:hypothetical protein
MHELQLFKLHLHNLKLNAVAMQPLKKHVASTFATQCQLVKYHAALGIFTHGVLQQQ